jgi:4-hydroxybenzoate polyprenyltransferase
MALSFVKDSIITLWLFTVNDFKTMIFPSIAFAVSYSLGGSYDHITAIHLLTRLPYLFGWTWINLLAFAVNNQRHPASITEDGLNKPWRPIPAGRISSRDAQILGSLAYPLAIITSFLVGGGLIQTLLLAVLGSIYNHPRAANWGFVVRNLLNAFGFTSFASGTLDVALRLPNVGHSVLLDKQVLSWLCMLMAIILTTVHSQDLYDQAGDAVTGRKTVPLVIGDGPARWSIALGTVSWSIVSAWYWNSGLLGYAITGTIGTWVAGQTLILRTVAEDRVTFTVYNGWLVSMYLLPFVAKLRNYGAE